MITKYRKQIIESDIIKGKAEFIKSFTSAKNIKIYASDAEKKNKYLYMLVYEKGLVIKKIYAGIDFSTLNHIYVISYKTKRILPQKKDGFEVSSSLFTLYGLGPFCSEIPLGTFVNKHTIATEEEKKLFLQYNPNLEYISKILFKDPQCIWIDAKIGDLIKIEGSSLTIGHDIDYRFVVKEPETAILGNIFNEEEKKKVKDVEEELEPEEIEAQEQDLVPEEDQVPEEEQVPEEDQEEEE